MSVLIITNKDDVTVDFIIKELRRRKISYYRLNTEDIPDKINVYFNFQNNKFELIDKIKEREKINLLDFNSVYYRRPSISCLEYINGMNTQELSYLKNELLYIFEGLYKILRNKYWLNNVYDIREAENKIYQLQSAQEIGFNIPNSLISNSYKQINSFLESCSYDCIIKPIKSGNMNDSTTPKAIFTTKLKNEQIDCLNRIEAFPIFIQNNVPKLYDLRVTVVGNNAYSAQIHSQENLETKIDWRRGERALNISIHELPIETKNKCILLTQKMSLKFSAIDLVFDENENYIFLELNPNGQWGWIEKRLGFPISKDIVDMLIQEG